MTRIDPAALACHRIEGATPTIVFLPGYASDMSGTKALALEEWARANGRAFLRFDYRGCGESPGAFEDFTLADWYDDVLAMLDTIEGPAVLVGSSMGGWLALLVARDRPNKVAGLVGVAPAPDFTDWGFTDAQKRAFVEAGRVLEESVYSDQPTVTTRGFWEAGERLHVLGGAIGYDGPVRIVQGQADRDVPWGLAPRIAEALRSGDVQTVLVKDGDHRLSRASDIALIIRAIKDVLACPDPVLLAAQQAAAPVPTDEPPAPVAGPPSPEEVRYHDCLKLATTDPRAAATRANQWRLEGGGFVAQQCLGLAYANQGQWPAAAAEFVGAAQAAQAKRDDRAATYWAEAGNARLAGGDAAGARSALDAALAAGTLDGKERAEAQLDRARALVATGDLAQARVDLDHALAAVPQDALAWLLSATLARRMGDLARAHKDIAEAAKRAPDAAPVELEMGNIAAKSGDQAGAKAAWQRAVTLAPDSPEGRLAEQALQQFRNP